MKYKNFDIYFPKVGVELPWNQWEIVGMAAWLWCRSGLHRSWELNLFESEVLESVESQQFVLITRNNQPAAYLSWGHLSDEAEVKYILNPHNLRREDKQSGRHLWLLNWAAPHGGTKEFSQVARQILFHRSVGHMLRVKPGNHDSGRIVSARGALVSQQDYAKEILRMHGNFVKAQQLRQGNFR